MLRRILELRVLLAMAAALVVGAWGLHGHPLDPANVYLQIVELSHPTAFLVIVSTSVSAASSAPITHLTTAPDALDAHGTISRASTGARVRAGQRYPAAAQRHRSLAIDPPACRRVRRRRAGAPERRSRATPARAAEYRQRRSPAAGR